ncbi:TPA: hypothetical protein DCW54_01015 [Candidatus Dependentiae bacterium]|nr:MAG: hypothetical protein A2017_06980 [Lentisphaerae bacterium GWF2_44_16]HAU30202.1 hypothetical protein [Candidatus Dependentiae bacterium]
MKKTTLLFTPFLFIAFGLHGAFIESNLDRSIKKTYSPSHLAQNALQGEEFCAWEEVCIEEENHKNLPYWTFKSENSKFTFIFKNLAPVWVKYSKPNKGSSYNDLFVWAWDHINNTIKVKNKESLLNRGHPSKNSLKKAKKHKLLCKINTKKKTTKLILNSPSLSELTDCTIQLKELEKVAKTLSNKRDPLFLQEEDLPTFEFTLKNGKIIPAITTRTQQNRSVTKKTIYAQKRTDAKNAQVSETVWTVQDQKKAFPCYEAHFIDGVLVECITRLKNSNKLIKTIYRKVNTFESNPKWFGETLTTETKSILIPLLCKTQEKKERYCSPQSLAHNPANFLKAMSKIKENSFGTKNMPLPESF